MSGCGGKFHPDRVEVIKQPLNMAAAPGLFLAMNMDAPEGAAPETCNCQGMVNQGAERLHVLTGQIPRSPPFSGQLAFEPSLPPAVRSDLLRGRGPE